MIDIVEDWKGGIDELVQEANRWLSVVLPADRSQRPKDEVNPRLVRHYTTQGLLPSAGREGRDARYTRHHLLALLALRRLMADGLSGKALYAALWEKGESELEQLAVQGSGPVQSLMSAGPSDEADPHDDTLSFVKRLQARSRSVTSMADQASPVAQAPTPPAAPSPKIKRSKRSKFSRVVRVELRPGLELLVGDTFDLPTEERDWDALLDELRASLLDLRST